MPLHSIWNMRILIRVTRIDCLRKRLQLSHSHLPSLQMYPYYSKHDTNNVSLWSLVSKILLITWFGAFSLCRSWWSKVQNLGRYTWQFSTFIGSVWDGRGKEELRSALHWPMMREVWHRKSSVALNTNLLCLNFSKLLGHKYLAALLHPQVQGSLSWEFYRFACQIFKIVHSIGMNNKRTWCAGSQLHSLLFRPTHASSCIQADS